jgi:hypothetical protein
MATWFVCLGVFSAAPLFKPYTPTHFFSEGTDFFPPQDCAYGQGTTVTVLRVLTAAVSAPAGVVMSLLFDMLFLSQFLAVAFAKQSVDNLLRKLQHDTVQSPRTSSAELSRTSSNSSNSSASQSDKEW